MTFLEHLTEFRSRFLKSLLAVFGGSVLGLIFCKAIFYWLQEPMLRVLPQGGHFIATGPFESYTTYFKVAFFSGLFFSAPVLFYQFWRFVSPALEKKEKTYLLPFTALSVLLFVGGALFGYFIVFPTGFYYVNQVLEGTSIFLMPKMSDYLKVAMMLLLSFGLAFEMPLLIFFLGKIGILDYRRIRSYRRYMIVLAFMVAAILTPGPDVLSQCLLAIPLWLLYELGGVTLIFMEKKANP